jgi:DNA sulfur modification protein DndB
VGYYLVSEYPNDWGTHLEKLKGIDWSRSNARLWEGRATIGGRVSKAQNNLTLTVNVIKQMLGLPLTEAEEKAENSLLLRSGGGA